MRNAALVLGIIAGLIGMIVGFFSFGYIEAIQYYGEVDGYFEQVENSDLVQITSIIAPMLAIAGGAMARSRALWGGVLLLISAGGMYYAFGFNVFTMFPVAFAAVGGLLAVGAGKPDEPKAHF
ncbi:hypothetical protein [Falsiruegeria mediterranea]|jgi:hypothetical protein|uniref:Major facilitator superfamily (MFS) profile domain-containing protein n=1 Tax=Falsiruegeria mediterranea M17 TaxID=1200281 RepID=A0A2R8C588_9RHOB|nr:hypothetical protein [Falsiruegeria mediterranea]SPJ27552.1 hypothetical protein TRM7615_01042 [Falsiruegeria mediterranea M17]